MARTNLWTQEQLIMALNVYFKIPFKDVTEKHPLIQKYAPLIGRTPTALKMKIGNFGRLDPTLKAKNITGLGHGSSAEEAIWTEFWGNLDKLAFESERLFAERAGKNVEQIFDTDVLKLPQGRERAVMVRQRVNQQFFRNAVLTAYLNQCCITGISNTPLLEACHISGWADDENNRTNPKNGLCMTPTFHCAYDKFLMAVTPDYKIVLSDEMLSSVKDELTLQYFKSLQNRHIRMPEKFAPEQEFLAQHFEAYRQKR